MRGCAGSTSESGSACNAMSFAMRLDLRQSQGLVMTPQLQQAIKLLQLSNLELQAYVEDELEQNPFLERDDQPAEAGAVEAAGDGDAARPLDGQATIGDSEAGDGWSGAADEGWQEGALPGVPDGLGINDLAATGRGGSIDFSEPDDDLGEQLTVDVDDPVQRLIGVHLIDQIDDGGYLRGDLVEVADRLGVDNGAVLAVLERLQRFDPPGVFARHVAECLSLQLKERGRFDPAMERLIANLHLVAQANIPALIRACGVLPDDLPEMIAELKALDPKPGLAFGTEAAETVVPDIFVVSLGAGRWRVELNGATLPRVLVNATYFADVARGSRNERDRSFASERFQTANWLVKALDQRARTVLRVAEAVVARQQAFLERGVRHLRPLVLRDIAEATELHESTISRATADKFVATPRGTFPFKYFFSNALPGTGGEDSHAAAAIRQQIRELIDAEPPGGVLSDDQIVDSLKVNGVSIARRTVAKYRESLAIPSSIQRKRAKALRLA
jgi:RNA polymerase sigma-54 factor